MESLMAQFEPAYGDLIDEGFLLAQLGSAQSI